MRRYSAIARFLLNLVALALLTPAIARAEPTSALEPGAPAPDFAYNTPFGWRHLHDLYEQSPVLMIFDPGADDLTALEREAPALSARGVEVIAVLRASDGANWATLDRLDLTYTLFSDPRGAVAEAFGVAELDAAHSTPAWCLVGTDRRMRRFEPGMPPRDETVAMVERALETMPVDVAGGEGR